ncbi:hypothetical protein NUW54_g11689 [Trametes sanguinea]|uniref:Uncharacterized protein n=1 Tax=Trametes sanguinea TaxID=158606 RepID=A0ACC1NB51_9APHY|nr:hypothetical protein NUW54_g11689 [Trametes sanguinea]
MPKCSCGKSYLTKSALGRHRASCRTVARAAERTYAAARQSRPEGDSSSSQKRVRISAGMLPEWTFPYRPGEEGFQGVKGPSGKDYGPDSAASGGPQGSKRPLAFVEVRPRGPSSDVDELTAAQDDLEEEIPTAEAYDIRVDDMGADAMSFLPGDASGETGANVASATFTRTGRRIHPTWKVRDQLPEDIGGPGLSFAHAFSS